VLGPEIETKHSEDGSGFCTDKGIGSTQWGGMVRYVFSVARTSETCLGTRDVDRAQEEDPVLRLLHVVLHEQREQGLW
jgi:hypothetical protein